MFMFPKVQPGPGEVVVVHRRGRFERILEPGATLRRRRDQVCTPVTLREQVAFQPMQEISSADGLVVKASAAATWRVVDARTFVEAADDPHAALALAMQIALRDLVAQVDAEALVRRVRTEPELQGALCDAAARDVAHLGIEVVQVVVRDVVLPVELRRANVELATAKARGLTQLEEARGRTAALRAMANSAKMLDDHPALARLQLLEAAPPDARIVLWVGDQPPTEV